MQEMLSIEHQVKWDAAEEDEWLLLPEEEFQVWKPHDWWAAQEEMGYNLTMFDDGWADPFDTEMKVFLDVDPSWGASGISVLDRCGRR